MFRRKRRTANGPSKSELRASRADYVESKRAQTGSLRLRYPYVRSLTVDLRLQAPSGATLDASKRVVGLDEPLLLDVTCPGGCNDGKFLLTDAVEAMLQTRREERQGTAACQAAFYADPKMTCGTQLFYGVFIQYE